MGNGISATIQEMTPAATNSGETRIASYLLTEYLERLGVEVIFGFAGTR